MDMFLYLDVKTFVHSLDPRTKLLLMLFSFATAVMFDNILILALLFCIALVYGASGRILSNLRRIRIVLLMITLFSLFIWSIAKGGETRFLIFSLEGLLYGTMIAIKTNLMIVSGMIFLSTTKIEEISEGLVKLHLPYRGAFAFSTAIRLVPMIVATSYTIIQAQKSRGLDLESGNIIQKIKKYGPLMIPTLISVIRGTNIFSMALESKGFGYSEKRSNYLELSLGKADYLMMFIGICILSVAVYVKIDTNLYAALLTNFPWSEYA